VSNSARAKERRSKRGRASKHKRVVMSDQHSGDSAGVKRSEVRSTEKVPGGLSAIEQRMQELRDKL